MGPEEYLSAFAPFADQLRQIPQSAWADLSAWVPEVERANMFPIPRAGFVQWRMIVHAERISGTNGPVRMGTDDDGLHVLYVEKGDSPLGVEIAKAADDGWPRRKNSTSKNSAMMCQTRFAFIEGE